MNIYRNIFCGALLLSAAALTGCSDEETYDVRGDKNNLVYVDATQSNVTEHTLYRTPVGVYGSTETTVPVRMQYAVEGSDITVTGSVDTTLVSKYNQANGTSYLSMPDDVLKALAITPAQIEKGQNAASTNLIVDIPEGVRMSLTGSDYVLPVRLNVEAQGGDRPIAASQDMGYAYMVVHMSTDIAGFSGNTTANTSVVNTPVGTFGGINGTFNVKLNSELGTDVKVSAEVDNSLVSAYNDQNGTAYEALPSSVASALAIEPSTVAAGQTAGTIKVNGDKDLAKDLKGEGYVIPLRLVMTYSDGTVVKGDKAVAYLVLTIKESLINSNPTELLGEPQYDCDGWECISAKGFKASEMTMDGWKIDGSRIASASFVVDMKESHKVGSFMYNGYVVKSARFYLSTDGANWTDLGDVSGNNTVRDDDWNSWYVLYGGVPARYVKVELSMDTNSWAWNYPQWGYCSISWGVAFAD